MRQGHGAAKRYTLLLINPRLEHKHYGAGQELSRLLGKKKIGVPLALPLVAALTPGHYDVRIIDDETDRIPVRLKPDLVALTTTVSCINRAYQIADQFRARGVPVVMGGNYATFCPDEVLAHADAVVVGEAEPTWHRVLDDFEHGRLQPTYRAECTADLSRTVAPRWDLVDTREVITVGVETSRGCPYSCDFCLVNKVFGRKMRYRPVADVVAEIRGLPTKNLFFVDDNITINKTRARELMGALVPLGLSWVCQCSIDVADDPELLAAMARAGCMSILVGFESLDPASLAETNKRHNRVEHYGEAVRAIHRHGIHVIASFVVGFDADRPESFDQILSFVEANHLTSVMLSILAAAPGTDIWERMREQGRLSFLSHDHINGMLPCMQYQHFSQVEMLDRYAAALERLFDPDAVRRRAVGLFSQGDFRTPSTGVVSTRDKVAASLTVIDRYLLRGGPRKRRLLVELVRLGTRGTVAMDQVVVFLLQMEGMFAFMQSLRRELPRLRAAIAARDPGPVQAVRPRTASSP